jgi:uncharacterized protein involved in type VI secretion and phage assembly
MKSFRGVMPGVVKSLADPDGLGRVQVHFPQLGGDNRSFWASIAAPMAGPKRGVFFQPELEDEVLVASESGMEHLYVVGFLWNGQDPPPETDPKNRVIVTPGGHQVRFEDTPGKKKVVIKSSGGLTFTLDDAAKSIELSGGGRTITIQNGEMRIT